MLLSEEVDIKIGSLNMKYYESLGYYIPKRIDRKKNRITTPRGTIIKVKVQDLTKGSRTRLQFECDYCGEIFTKEYTDYIREKDLLVQKDCCKDCRHLKSAEINKIKYGVKSLFEKESFQDLCKNRIKEIYNVDNVFQSEKIKEKSKNTLKKKYGEQTNNIMDVPYFKELALNNLLKSLKQNSKISTSTQQLYIHDIIGGELNYLFEKFFLDIAFPNENIYVEYQGGGHDLSVKTKRLSLDEFNRKELKRYYILKQKNWKEIEILGADQDFLPNDDIIIDIINKSKLYLTNNNYNWVKIDLKNNNIVLKDKIISYNFGKLRRISKTA